MRSRIARHFASSKGRSSAPKNSRRASQYALCRATDLATSPLAHARNRRRNAGSSSGTRLVPSASFGQVSDAKMASRSSGTSAEWSANSSASPEGTDMVPEGAGRSGREETTNARVEHPPCLKIIIVIVACKATSFAPPVREEARAGPSPTSLHLTKTN